MNQQSEQKRTCHGNSVFSILELWSQPSNETFHMVSSPDRNTLVRTRNRKAHAWNERFPNGRKVLSSGAEAKWNRITNLLSLHVAQINLWSGEDQGLSELQQLLLAGQTVSPHSRRRRWIGQSKEIPANYTSKWCCKEQNSADEHTWPLEKHSAPDTKMIDWKEQMQIYSTFTKTKGSKGGPGQMGQLAGEELREKRQRSWKRGAKEWLTSVLPPAVVLNRWPLG